MTTNLSRLLTVATEAASKPEAILLGAADPIQVSTFWSLEETYPDHRLRYHLGQICMVRLMNSLAGDGNVVKAVICDPDHLTRKMERQAAVRADLFVTSRFIELVADRSIAVERMSRLTAQRKQAHSPRFQLLRDAVSRAVMEFRDAIGQVSLGDKAEKALTAYRRYLPGSKPPPELRPLSASLQQAFPGVASHLLLAAAFGFYSQPTWFSAPWLVDFTAYLAEEGTREPLPVLLEADRSAYAWLLMRCLFEISSERLEGSRAAWPHLLLLRSVPSLTGEGAMRRLDKDTALFLDGSRSEVEERVRATPADVRRDFNLLFLDDQQLVDVAEEEWIELFTRQFWKWRARVAELLRQERDGAARRPGPEGQERPEGTQAEKFDVFLCHNSQDKAEIRRIGRLLKAKGLRPWLDEWELPPGQRWQPLLEQQIERIGAAAVFVGPSGAGPWQQMEIDALLQEFVKRGCPVIPVILEQCEEAPELPLFLKTLTWVDFRAAEPDPLKRLIWGITRRKGGREPGAD
jgi:TIR domain